MYLTVLRKDLPSPLAKESDEEKSAKEAKETKEPKDVKDAKDQPGSPDAPHGGGAPADTAHPDVPFRIDLDDIQFRILDMPIPAGNLSRLQAGNAGRSTSFARSTRNPRCSDLTSRSASRRP